MSGIIYFKKEPSEYYNNMVGYDYTKRSSLVGCEIDNNFFVLEGRDLSDLYMEGKYLVFKFINGEEKRIFVNPYKQGCGISIGNMDSACGNQNINSDNTISLKKKEMGGISCFDGKALVSTGCGITITTETENRENFRNYLLKMLGNYVGNLYVNSLTKINGEFYGGIVTTDACSAPDYKNDQFYSDYLDFIKNGKLSINVCGIECSPDGTAKINVDDSTICLDNCKLKVNYGCGLIEKYADETDYLIWLKENWKNLNGTQGVGYENYIMLIEKVNNENYGGENNVYKDDQFYNLFFQNENYPKLSINIDENSGIACGENGIYLDYGCGLTINEEPNFEDFVSFANFMNFAIKDIDKDNWTDVNKNPYYSSFINCWGQGILKVNIAERNGVNCINGKLGISLDETITITKITPECNTGDDSYFAFLENNWNTFSGDSGVYLNDYINGLKPVNGEYFGGASCIGGCDFCEHWFDDQFFCDYVSYVKGGKITCLCSGGDIPIQEKQADWSIDDETSIQYIRNKPTVGNGTVSFTKNGTIVDYFNVDTTTDVKISLDNANTFTNITYEELYTKYLTSNLVEGMYYRIIDYQPISIQNYTEIENCYFDIVVLAVSENCFSSKAFAVEKNLSGITPKFTNEQMSKWEIWYDFDPAPNKYMWYDEYVEAEMSNGEIVKIIRFPDGDRDVSNPKRFAWYYVSFAEDSDSYTHLEVVYSTSVDFKNDTNLYDEYNQSLVVGNVTSGEMVKPQYGVIYRLIDENGNDCPYDFKSIKFLGLKFVPEDMIKIQSVDGTTYVLNNNLYYYTFTKADFQSSNITSLNDFSSDINCNRNKIGPSIINYDINGGAVRVCYFIPYNTFITTETIAEKEPSISCNTLGDQSSFNTFFINPKYNKLDEKCSYNWFYLSNTYNVLAYACKENIFKESCSENMLGMNCNAIKLEQNNIKNSFDDACYAITIGENSMCNKFGYACYSIEMPSNVEYNEFKNNCKNIFFTNSTNTDSNYGKYASNNIFMDNCSFIYFGATLPSGSRNKITCYEILPNTKGTKVSYLNITSDNQNLSISRSNIGTYFVGLSSTGLLSGKNLFD